MKGFLTKMPTRLEAGRVKYSLHLDQEIDLNARLGQPIYLAFTGEMHCVSCGRAVKKTFQQGHCFPCVRSKAACDLCIVKPERCHFHLGTCREPEWGEAHCMQKHVVYLANTSGLKVGITRIQNIPHRFMDQGATQALPLFEVDSRYHSGLIEILLAQHLDDKTNWRKMLQGEALPLDLQAEKEKLAEQLTYALESLAVEHKMQIKPAPFPLIELAYPVLKYPQKLVSLSFDKTPVIEGVLEGIKAQYLILSTGVLNIRNFSGYQVILT